MDGREMSIYYQDESTTVYHGDCIAVLASMPDNSVDAIVTDPPYGLSNTRPDQVAETITRWVSGDREYLPTGRGFMGKEWDAFVPPVAMWDECLRVLKPGGHLVSFAGSRTHDLMTLGIRLAGFEIRDSVAWLYGSGFPKSMDVSKAIDKVRAEDREPRVAVTSWVADECARLGWSRPRLCKAFGVKNQPIQSWTERNPDYAVIPTWENWRQLKALVGFGDGMDAEVWRLNGRKGTPGEAWEKREVVGVQKGAMSGWNMDGTTKFADRNITTPATPEAKRWEGWGTALKPAFEPIVLARKPLEGTVAGNVLAYGTGAINIDGCRIGTEGGSSIPGGMNSVNAGNAPHGYRASAYQTDPPEPPAPSGRWPANVLLDEHAAAWVDEQSGVLKPGGASRFFYVAKAPKTERPNVDGVQHPTVKPLAIMRWLIRLVTPPGGTVLDPFAGSGTTIEAAMMEGFHPIGIEREPDYLPLITTRITRAKTFAQEALDLGGIA